MKWLIRVEGPEAGLNELSQFLKNPELRIFKDEEFYYVESSQLTNIEESDTANDIAKLILAEIKGIAELLLCWNIPITLGAMVKSDDSGKFQTIIQKDLKFCVRAAIPRIVKYNNEEVKLDPAKFFPQYLHLAMTDELVRYVIQMVDFGFDQWWGLFCIEDAIEWDIGKTEEGKTKKINWMDQKERTRFRATVQDRRIIGKYARHGHPDGVEPYANPMTLLEAQKFIWNTTIKWLDEKIANQQRETPSPA
jgi:hypothetical protein